MQNGFVLSSLCDFDESERSKGIDKHAAALVERDLLGQRDRLKNRYDGVLSPQTASCNTQSATIETRIHTGDGRSPFRPHAMMPPPDWTTVPQPSLPHGAGNG